MSNSIIQRAYESTVTSPTDMSVLFALADQANDDGVCWPSVGSISSRTRLNERTVQKALRRLAADHHISVTGNVYGGYKGHTPTYLVHPIQTKGSTGASGSPGEPSTPGESGSGRTTFTTGVNVETRRGERGDAMGRTTFTQTLIEPSMNPKGTLSADASARNRASQGTPVLLDVDPLQKKRKGGAGSLAVEWDGTEFRVPEVLLAQWRKAFPQLNVTGCIREAAMWVIDHPARSRKKPGARFLEGWLKRTRPSESPSVADDSDPVPPPLPVDGPAGWEKAYAALYDHEPTRRWAQQIDAVQEECGEWLKARRVS